ncbi:hypothetical protein, partial [Rhizobium leguminosarum]|uniref:hypothetical protein n=1 Tax=Rhizobium leguminosarum TaxID=384 RepID=UPI003F9C6743
DSFLHGLDEIHALFLQRFEIHRRGHRAKAVDEFRLYQEAVGADLQSNGLELESVSLTRLDQNDIKHFKANNFFDAQGLAA